MLLLIQWELQASRHQLMIIEKSASCPGVGNDCTGAHLPLRGVTCVAELGSAGMRLPFFDLQFPRQAMPQLQPTCTPTATYVADL
jgi:hypothetical protein